MSSRNKISKAALRNISEKDILKEMDANSRNAYNSLSHSQRQALLEQAKRDYAAGKGPGANIGGGGGNTTTGAIAFDVVDVMYGTHKSIKEAARLRKLGAAHKKRMLTKTLKKDENKLKKAVKNEFKAKKLAAANTFDADKNRANAEKVKALEKERRERTESINSAQKELSSKKMKKAPKSAKSLAAGAAAGIAINLTETVKSFTKNNLKEAQLNEDKGNQNGLGNRLKEKAKQKGKKYAGKAGGKAAKFAVNVTKKIVKTVVKFVVKIVNVIVRALIEILGACISTFGLPVVIIVILIIAICVGLCAVLGGAEGSIGTANVPYECEAYASLIDDVAATYDMSDYAEIMKCIMIYETEYNDVGLDVMHSSSFIYNTDYPNGIDYPEYSIMCGVRYFKDLINASGCEDITDEDGLYMAIQGYYFGTQSEYGGNDYGGDYVEWANDTYGCWTTTNATLYSSQYSVGVSEDAASYVGNVLMYYVMVNGYDTSLIGYESVISTLDYVYEEYSDYDLDEGRWGVICQGASIIGEVKYSMDTTLRLHNSSGEYDTDNPAWLDCSSFVAWSFHKAGYTNVQQGSNTDTFLLSSNNYKTSENGSTLAATDTMLFSSISYEELLPGDIGLKTNVTGNTGGGNHVGIYVGKDSSGNDLWLHCTTTSYTVDGITYPKASDGYAGDGGGPRIAVYNNFNYYYRYIGFY